MATISITSNDGELSSASAVLEVSATNPDYNQPALRVKQAGTTQNVDPDRLPNPDIELVQTGFTDPAYLGAGGLRLQFRPTGFRSMASMAAGLRLAHRRWG